MLSLSSLTTYELDLITLKFVLDVSEGVNVIAVPVSALPETLSVNETVESNCLVYQLCQVPKSLL